MARISAANNVFYTHTGVIYAIPPRAMPLIDALRAAPQGDLFRNLRLPGHQAAWYPLMSDLESIGVITLSHILVDGRRSIWLALEPAFRAATAATEVRVVGRRG